MHATLEKFGYPDSVVKEYNHWVVMLRPKQPTLGSLVLVSKSEDTAYGRLSAEAFAEQQRAVADIEATLRAQFGYDKINYMMLMMVDPQVHFHVIPRYAEPRNFEGVEAKDTGWPALPDMGHDIGLSPAAWTSLKEQLKKAWNA